MNAVVRAGSMPGLLEERGHHAHTVEPAGFGLDRRSGAARRRAAPWRRATRRAASGTGAGSACVRPPAGSGGGSDRDAASPTRSRDGPDRRPRPPATTRRSPPSASCSGHGLPNGPRTPSSSPGRSALNPFVTRPDEADRVTEPLRVRRIRADRDRDLADAEQVQHVELPGLERVTVAVAVTPSGPERGRLGRLRDDPLDDRDPSREHPRDRATRTRTTALTRSSPPPRPSVMRMAAISSVTSMPTGHHVMQRPQPTHPDVPYWSIHDANL